VIAKHKSLKGFVSPFWKDPFSLFYCHWIRRW